MNYNDDFASIYDLIYADKNYKAECDFLDKLFKQYSALKVNSILDIACGTGNHSLELARRGYKVTGNDLSTDMIAVARSKVNDGEISFTNYFMEEFQSEHQFDAILCMFASINYLNDDAQFIKLFNVVKKHLKKGGVFIFDFWYGPAVLNIRPSERTKKIEGHGISVTRIARPELEEANHICRVNYSLTVQKDDNIETTEETHVIRFLFPDEIERFTSGAGLKMVKLCPFLELEGTADENTWNATAVLSH